MKLDATTDEDIARQIAEDPDTAPELTDADLADAERHEGPMSTYDADFVQWADEQAKLLRDRASNQLDWEHLCEEIEGLASSDRDQVHTRLMRVCEHLLKLAYQVRTDPPTSWQVTLIEQRARLDRLLKKSPSLRPYAATELASAYTIGRRKAAVYTPNLPETCPWTIEQVLNPDFLPSGDS